MNSIGRDDPQDPWSAGQVSDKPRPADMSAGRLYHGNDMWRQVWRPAELIDACTEINGKYDAEANRSYGL